MIREHGRSGKWLWHRLSDKRHGRFEEIDFLTLATTLDAIALRVLARGTSGASV